MASQNGTTTTFGASIVPVQAQSEEKQTALTSTLDSPAITPTPSHEDLNASRQTTNDIPSHSPFYQKPLTRLQPTHARDSSKSSTGLNEKDLEAATPLSPEDDDNPFTSKVSVECSKECKMWPSKQTLMQTKMEEKKRKRDRKMCGPVLNYWARFDNRQKLFIKIALALFLIGVAVAIAVGISVAVNGSVYVSNNKTKQIPDPST